MIKIDSGYTKCYRDARRRIKDPKLMYLYLMLLDDATFLKQGEVKIFQSGDQKISVSCKYGQLPIGATSLMKRWESETNEKPVSKVTIRNWVNKLEDLGVIRTDEKTITHSLITITHLEAEITQQSNQNEVAATIVEKEVENKKEEPRPKSSPTNNDTNEAVIPFDDIVSYLRLTVKRRTTDEALIPSHLSDKEKRLIKSCWKENFTMQQIRNFIDYANEVRYSDNNPWFAENNVNPLTCMNITKIFDAEKFASNFIKAQEYVEGKKNPRNSFKKNNLATLRREDFDLSDGDGTNTKKRSRLDDFDLSEPETETNKDDSPSDKLEKELEMVNSQIFIIENLKNPDLDKVFELQKRKNQLELLINAEKILS